MEISIAAYFVVIIMKAEFVNYFIVNMCVSKLWQGYGCDYHYSKVHSQIVSVQERLKCLQTVEFQNINSEL